MNTVTVEKWGMVAITMTGNSDGNPYLDYTIQATFTCEEGSVTVDGFYDGDGTWKVRFMPEYEGHYTFTVSGTFINEKTGRTDGEFEATAPSENNHGRVVAEDTHLQYEDGTPYYSMGTTCYAWVNQSIKLQKETLKTLKEGPFNKIRFCFFPKFYTYNYREPLTYPFMEGEGEGCDPELLQIAREKAVTFPGQRPAEHRTNFNYLMPNPEHFKRFDKRIAQLREMGIEADLILMHPYDNWGNVAMSKEACDAYLKYIVARYGAFRNVWWSLANEYDLMFTKTPEDWERYGELIAEKDVYHHMCSVHNCMKFYDFSKPWVTHCSCQRQDTYRTTEYTDEYVEKYGKPVVWDEICYEGNIQFGWGNITGQELVRRFWEAVLRGGHAGHGETFLAEDDILWWSHGGKLKGESAPRIQFLLDILKETPGGYMKHGRGSFDEVVGIPSNVESKEGMFFVKSADYEIHYYGSMQPAFRELNLEERAEYQVDVIDTWNMTVTDAGVHSGFTKIDLPGKQYMAIRLQKISEEAEEEAEEETKFEEEDFVEEEDFEEEDFEEDEFEEEDGKEEE